MSELHALTFCLLPSVVFASLFLYMSSLIVSFCRYLWTQSCTLLVFRYKPSELSVCCFPVVFFSIFAFTSSVKLDARLLFWKEPFFPLHPRCYHMLAQRESLGFSLWYCNAIKMALVWCLSHTACLNLCIQLPHWTAVVYKDSAAVAAPLLPAHRESKREATKKLLPFTLMQAFHHCGTQLTAHLAQAPTYHLHK